MNSNEEESTPYYCSQTTDYSTDTTTNWDPPAEVKLNVGQGSRGQRRAKNTTREN
jgi:hypothetical protein